MKLELITLSSDFGVGTQGIGAMEAVAWSIARTAKIVHLMHGLPSFDISAGARTMETVQFIPVPGVHVCVVDPGVGTKRRGVAIQVGRGDVFVGPDNGLFLPAARILGGIQTAHELSNATYHREPVSPIFHGRDIFAPVAGHIASGVPLSELGAKIDPSTLVGAPYDEAVLDGRTVHGTVIQINHFGSLHLNILHSQWDGLNVSLGVKIRIRHAAWSAEATFGRTFGDVGEGEVVLLRDDYGRIEIAVNMGRLAERYPTAIGDTIAILVP